MKLGIMGAAFGKKLQINLDQIEETTYRSYHDDGLIDLAVGVAVTIFGVGMMQASPLLMILPGALSFPLWSAARKSITRPRFGVVNFNPKRQAAERSKHLAPLGNQQIKRATSRRSVHHFNGKVGLDTGREYFRRGKYLRGPRS